MFIFVLLVPVLFMLLPPHSGTGNSHWERALPRSCMGAKNSKLNVFRINWNLFCVHGQNLETLWEDRFLDRGKERSIQSILGFHCSDWLTQFVVILHRFFSSCKGRTIRKVMEGERDVFSLHDFYFTAIGCAGFFFFGVQSHERLFFLAFFFVLGEEGNFLVSQSLIILTLLTIWMHGTGVKQILIFLILHTFLCFTVIVSTIFIYSFQL